MTAALLPTQQLLIPGSDEWARLMTGSKIAAVVGLSPYQSRFGLWHQMAGTLGPDVETDEMLRGRYLEPACLAWLTDQHPTWTVRPNAVTVRSDERPDWGATPDGYASIPGQDRQVLVEAKTDAGDQEWGEPGTDQIPPGYRCQVQWAMRILGAARTHLVLLTSRLEFREYVIDYDPADGDYLAAQADEFMHTLPGGRHPRRPAIDGHSATYVALRALHPDIDPDEIVLPASLARRFGQAVRAAKAADRRKQEATSRVAARMGRARYATTPDGTRVATRVPGRNGAPPYVKAHPNVTKETSP